MVHAATYIGSDAALCSAVNVEGTRNVAAAARAAGARLVYVSTAAVYGRGPFDMLVEGGAPIRPTSPLSESRAEAERMVLESGGIVVRPHLVIGAGDRWVGKGLAALTRAVGGLVDDGRARHSVIEVGTLGALLVSLATAPILHHTLYHASNLEPLTTRELGELLWPQSPPPSGGTSSQEAASIAKSLPTLQRAFDLITVDHVFDARAASTDSTTRLSQPVSLSASATDWYRVDAL